MQAYRHGGVCLKSSGALEVRCRSVEMRRYGGMEDWRLATGVATWTNGGKYELATDVVPEVLKC